MHELGLLTGVVKAVNEAANGREVASVELAVGALSGVVEESLHSAWPMAKIGECSNAELHTRWIPAAVWCPSCQQEQPIDEFFALCCPVCGTPTADLRRGREFQVESVEVVTPD